MTKGLLIITFTVVPILMLSMQAQAITDFRMGGSLRVDLAYSRLDKDAAIFSGLGNDDITDFKLTQALAGNSRLNFKARVNDVTGFVELGFGGRALSLRHAYAFWDITDDHSLLFGHTWNLFAFGFTDQRLGITPRPVPGVQPGLTFDLANIGFGTFYTGRLDQVRLSVAYGDSSFKIAVMDNPTAPSFGGLSVGSDIPRFETAARFNVMEVLILTPSAVFAHYSSDNTLTGRDEDIRTWGIALDGRLRVAHTLRISFEGWWGQNLGTIESDDAGHMAADDDPQLDIGGIEDTTSYGGFIQASIPVITTILSIGFGYQRAENDSRLLAKDSTAQWSWFINIVYNITDTFYIQPEFSYFDFGDSYGVRNAAGAVTTPSADRGSEWVAGVHLQADF